MLRAVLFIAFSGALLPVSWRSLGHPHTHGFYRFFAFEFLLGLVLRNAPVWFHDPFSARQWVAWCLGVVSIGLAIEGFRLLRLVGKPGPDAAVSTNFSLENTTQLVTTGAYRWIRHPLYASLLALVLCAYFKDPLGGWSILMTLAAGGSLFATALAEERENEQRFGEAYVRYMRSTKRFIPFVF